MRYICDKICLHAFIFGTVIHCMQKTFSNVIDRLRKAFLLAVQLFNVNFSGKRSVPDLLHTLPDLILLHCLSQDHIALSC